MAKSKPVGLRYDLNIYNVAKNELGIDTPQQYLNYFEKLYIDNRKHLKTKNEIVNDSFLLDTKDKNKNSDNTIFISKEIKNICAPKNLSELKEICPFKEIGEKRSEWLRTERPKYNF